MQHSNVNDCNLLKPVSRFFILCVLRPSAVIGKRPVSVFVICPPTRHNTTFIFLFTHMHVETLVALTQESFTYSAAFLLLPRTFSPPVCRQTEVKIYLELRNKLV